MITSPTNASAIAMYVRHVIRSPRNTRATTTPNSGVVDPRKAALAADVVLTAYTNPIDASSRATLAAIIRRPDVNARSVLCGLPGDQCPGLDDDDDADRAPRQVLKGVGLVGDAGEHGAEAPDRAGGERHQRRQLDDAIDPRRHCRFAHWPLLGDRGEPVVLGAGEPELVADAAPELVDEACRWLPGVEQRLLDR